MNNYDMFYDANTAFVKGNIEKSSYDGYKNYEPTEPQVNSEKEATLLFIQKCENACQDLTLFLDSHPSYKVALDLRDFYRKEAEKAIDKYQKQYGVINLRDNELVKAPFRWIDAPWPWEV